MRRFRSLLVPLVLAQASSAAFAADANRVQRIVVGSGSALAACEGLDARNDQRVNRRFPANPELAFRIRVPGGIGHAPASDAAGHLIIVHSEPRLSKLDGKGRTVWTQRLPSEASTAPVLTSSGAILLVTRDGEALLFSSSGQRLFRHALPIVDPKRSTLAIPTENGGALIASGADLVQLDHEASLVRSTRANGIVTAIAESGGRLVAVNEAGSVEVAHASGAFELAGSFAGMVPFGAAVSAGFVYAIVDGHSVRALELSTGRVTTLVSEATLALHGPLTIFANRSLAYFTEGGLVSVRGPDGSEHLRAAVGVAGRAFDPSQRAGRLISDSVGNVAVVQGGDDALLLRPDGSTLRLDGTNCIDPFRPTPTAGGIVLACRSGQLFGVSDRAP